MPQNIRTRKRYEARFKMQTLKIFRSEWDGSVSEFARIHKINKSTFYQWLQKSSASKPHKYNKKCESIHLKNNLIYFKSRLKPYIYLFVIELLKSILMKLL